MDEKAPHSARCAPLLVFLTVLLMACSAMAADWKECCRLVGHSFENHVSDVSFSADGKLVATASRDGTARVWNASDGTARVVFKGHEAPVLAVRFLPPDDRRLVSCGEDRTVRVWDLETAQQLAVFKHARTVQSVEPSADGRRLLTCAPPFALVWSVNETSRAVAQLFNREHVPWSVAFVEGGKRAVTIDSRSGTYVWELASFEPVMKIQSLREVDLMHAGSPELVPSPNGKMVAVWFRNRIEVWSLESGEKLGTSTSSGSSIVRCAWSRDSTSVAAAGEQGVRVIASTGAEVLRLAGNRDERFSVMYSPDGRFLAAEGWGDVVVWDTGTGRRTAILGHQRYVAITVPDLPKVIFSSDGRKIVSTAGVPIVWERRDR